MKKTNAKFLPNAVTKYNIGKYQAKNSQVKNLQYTPGRNLTPSDTTKNALSPEEIEAMKYDVTTRNLIRNKNFAAVKGQAEFMKKQGMNPKGKMGKKLGGSTNIKKRK